MNNLVELLKVIIWPATLIWILIYFKRDLRSLIERMNQLKYKELEANFERDISNVHAQVLSKKSSEKISIAHSENQAELDVTNQLYRIAQISPRAAIVEAWRHLENKINDFGRYYGLTAKGFASEKQILENLQREDKLDDQFLVLYAALRELRNRAAHKTEFPLSQQSAQEYIDSINELIEDIKNIQNAQ